jgi:Type II secretion system (T2SS), protein K
MIKRKPAVTEEALPGKVGRDFVPVPKRRRFRRARGAAILLSLWALFLLSAMIISWALDIGAKVTNSGYANRSLEAVAMACSGVDVAMHPMVLPNSPVLRGGLGPGQSYEAHITGEAGRLNLNWLVQAIITGQDQNLSRRELLRKFLEVKGIDLNDRERMIDCLIDWIDPDNLVQINGAEDEPGYKPANKPLANLEDLKRVRGWDEFTSRPGWDEDLTLKSEAQPGQGAIDVRWASRDVLLSLPGMTEGLVDRFLALRRGPDGEEGTEDDVTFKDPHDPPIQVALGLLPAQFNQLNGLISQNNQAEVLRIVSRGKSGAVTRTVRVVVRKAPGAIQLIPGTWKEL